MSHIKIEYASGLAATGKTTFIRENILSTYDDDLIIIVKPTIEMCETTGRLLRQANRHLPIVIIHSKNGSNGIEESQETVAARIKTELQQSADLGIPKIIICCHQSFLNVSLFPNKAECIVYWDEEFDPTDYHDHRLIPAEQEKFIFDGCICHAETDGYDLIKITKDAKDRIEMRLQQNDDLTAVLESVYEKMIDAYNEKYLLFIDKRTGGVNRFIMCSLRSPEIFSGFKRVVMFGARFENSLLYKLYGHEKLGVDWVEMPEWKNKNIQQSHHQPIEFYYAVDDAKHSKNSIIPILNTFLEGCSDVLNEKTTLYSSNKDYRTRGGSIKLADKLGSATELPFGCYGLDTFKHCNTLVYFGSYNRNSPYYHWLENMFDIASTFTTHHFYQSIMRLCLRDKEYVGPIRVYTPCLSLIQSVLDVFPNATIKKMDCSGECEKILYERDKRHFVSEDDGRHFVSEDDGRHFVSEDDGRHFVSEDDGRRSKWSPQLDGYILSGSWLQKQSEKIPNKMCRNLIAFQKKLEDCGYQRKDFTVNKTDSKGRVRTETIGVMAQFPDDFKKVIVLSGLEVIG